MGGDHLIPTVAGEHVEDQHGDALRDAWSEHFDEHINDVRPFDGARELLSDVKRRGFTVVLASSGKSDHVEKFIDMIDARSIADAWTSSDDVAASKPEPDLIQTALRKVDGTGGVMIGDSTWDIVAANKLHVPTIAVRTGGFSEEELADAGAVHIFDSLRELLDGLDRTPLKNVDER